MSKKDFLILSLIIVIFLLILLLFKTIVLEENPRNSSHELGGANFFWQHSTCEIKCSFLLYEIASSIYIITYGRLCPQPNILIFFHKKIKTLL